MRTRWIVLGLVLVACGCSASEEREVVVGEQHDASTESTGDEAQIAEASAEQSHEGGWDAEPDSAGQDADGSVPCPQDMQLVGTACMDLYEAPNVAGALPLVMFQFDEASAWCEHRGKRLCFDDEWTWACEGPDQLSYPYGDVHDPGVCNDDKPWIDYDQALLNGWPWSMQTEAIGSLQALLEAVRAKGTAAAAAADHVEALYQGTPAGSRAGCVGVEGVFDLTGNVEEWTRRRDGGEPGYHGKLKGRYWSEPRTCQMGVIGHGDGFRFYEIGFRCCRDASVYEP